MRILKNEDDSIWKSGKVLSPEPFGIIYSGSPLEPVERYYWKVKLWDLHDEYSDWSDTEYFDTGVIYLTIWKAEWIRAPSFFDSARQVEYFQRTINIDSQVLSDALL
jgi:alpha-L-rhamnosidase